MYCVCPGYQSYPSIWPNSYGYISAKCGKSSCIGKPNCSGADAGVLASATPCEGQGHRASCNFKVPQSGNYVMNVSDPNAVFSIYREIGWGTDAPVGGGWNGASISLSSGNFNYYVSDVLGASSNFSVCLIKV